MSGFDMLGRELESAAVRKPATPSARRAAGAGGAVVIALTLATVVVVAVGAVALLHGRRAPRPAARAPAQPASAAQGAAWARALSCPRPHSPAGNPAPVMTGAAPDPRLLAALGALRAPWVPADAAPAGTCMLTNAALPPQRAIDVRYIRYVGPGLRGGKMFLIPTAGTALPSGVPIPASVRRRIARDPWACLITVGGMPAASSGVDACTPLETIDRPFGVVPGAPVPVPVPLRIARRLCSHLPRGVSIKARGLATCLQMLTHPHVAPPQPQVVSGVVRDGAVTVEVYRLARHAGKPLLTGVAVRDNVYAFLAPSAVAGPLRLVFKDSSGRVIRTTPIHFGTLTATASSGRAHIQLVSGTSSLLPTSAKIRTGTLTPVRPSSQPGLITSTGTANATTHP